MSRSLVFLADSTSDLGDQDWAMGFCQKALELPATVGDSRNLSLALGTMGKILARHGQPGRAVEFFNRGRELDRQAGHMQGIAAHSVWLAHAARAQADHAQATVLYTETLALFRQVGDLGGFACCLEGLALIAAAEDRPDRAARLIGAATGILDAAGRVVPPADKAQGLELVVPSEHVWATKCSPQQPPAVARYPLARYTTMRCRTGAHRLRYRAATVARWRV